MAIMWKTRDLANQLSDSIRAEADKWKEKGIEPTISTLLVKGDPASEYYAQAKEKVARKLGIGFQLLTFDEHVSEQQLLAEIVQLNEDPSVHGIMLELPVPKHISIQKLSDAISPLKDVDGISSANKLDSMTGSEGIYPTTPQACIRILEHFGQSLQGKNVVLVGRGETVGRPLMHMLLRKNATLVVCHSYT